ncbi:hypothetical protein DIS24_g3017 [Lasiodiplodia hormozganensis]|uniref:Secreted protein n=1 Tax=Lasiodiplodia hormozganensis TaxID=869390 RepID=A0AA39Z0J2_9PEZI|nr:hypothetical protein DIS24_g3017 [Lasiodiplodia hormozganensis]
MHFATLTTIFLASTSMALPATTTPGAYATDIETSLDLNFTPTVNATADGLTKRDWAYNVVKFCEHANGKGKCAKQSFRHALCYNLDRWWNDRVSSIYPNPNTYCRMHVNRDCRGGAMAVGPNWSIADLKTINWNDKMSSLDCFSQAY